MTDSARALKEITEEIQSYAAKIRREPKSEQVESWARRIASLADDLDDLAAKIKRDQRRA